MLVFAALFLILYLLLGLIKLFLRYRVPYNYHHDPYYYYPRHKAPPNFSGYHHHPKQPYIPPFEPPYQPNVRHVTVRPTSWFVRLLKVFIWSMFVVAILCIIALKLDLGSNSMTWQNVAHGIPMDRFL
jgi:hypothetical protein